MKNFIIKSNEIQLDIASLGAEIQSLTLNGEQRFWTGNADFWSGKAPIIFPVCGRMRNKSYFYEGVEYPMLPHGFAKISEFEVVKIADNEITLFLKYNQKTLETYPFKFEFYITYRLENNTLFVKQEVVNVGENLMFFSLGSHESYLLEGDIENYCLSFEKQENFHSVIVDKDGLVTNGIDNFGDNTNTLPLGYHLVKNDTAVFANVNSRRVDLLKKGEKFASLTFDAPHFLVWTKPNAPFVCLEPWFNLPDAFNSNKQIIQKPGMITLEKNKHFISEHSITYFK